VLDITLARQSEQISREKYDTYDIKCIVGFQTFRQILVEANATKNVENKATKKLQLI
jgi:hypothetical protein